MSSQPYPEGALRPMRRMQYELQPGQNADMMQQLLDDKSPFGWTIHSFGVGHNGYFWVLLQREVTA
jgi:hypothetical protein